MNHTGCRLFERDLDRLLDGTLGGADRLDRLRHAESCDRCRELLDLARAGGPEGPDLTDAVLARTTGPACGAARERLCEYVDGRIDPAEAGLVRAHLGGCATCEGLASTLALLETDLPLLLAERPVDPHFLTDVLARTSRPERFDVRSALLSAWRGLLSRPRFALEAAYAMTLLLVLVLGVPSAPIAGVSRRAFELTAVELRPGIERSVNEARSNVETRAKEAWGATGGKLGADARTTVDDVAQFSSTVAEDIRGRVGTLWGRLASGESNEDDNRSPDADDRQEGERP